jgi:CRP-like cAMP-binding protein
VVDDPMTRAWSRNRLLAAIPAGEVALLRPYAHLVQLGHGEVLFEPEQDVVNTHFPLLGTLAALVVVLEDGRIAEAATMGYEGAIGGIVSAGEKPAFARAVIEVGGGAVRIETARIEKAKLRSPAIRDLFSRYADALLAQILQSVTCNAVHTLQQRYARWLLMTQDRIGSPELRLTQEAIGEMLGVHRATVIRVARGFQTEGTISYGRGRITILDRRGLEATTCECYEAVVRHYARILPLAARKQPRRRNLE